MNLVQIQERLKDAPTQSIMQYANGMNPMVPPYLALAELKRRESMTQNAQAQQAMQQGKAPSVKEQIEQASGLMALQQPQGIEGMMQQGQEMSGGGLAHLPVKDMYNFADGGIVAFAEGDLVGGEEGLKSLKQLSDEYWKALRQDDLQSAKRLKQVIEERKAAAPRTVTVPSASYEMSEEKAPVQQGIVSEAAPRGPVPAQTREGPLPPPGGIAGQLTMPERGGMAMPSGAPPGISERASVSMRQPAGIAALPGSDEASKMLLEAMRAKPSFDELYAAQQKERGIAGLAQPYGEERMKRAQAMEAARQQEMESRGMERLMRVMSGIGARGVSGASPAYLQSIEAERAADAAFRKQMDELMGGVEEKRRAEAVSGMTAAQRDVLEGKKLGLGAAEKVYDAQRKREDDLFRFQLEQKLKVMQPNEAMMFQSIMQDIQRRNPELPLADVYAKAMEAKQGVTPEIKREQLQSKAYNEAAKMWEEMMIKPKDISRDQWIEREVQNRLRSRGASQASNALPSDIDALLKKYGGK